MIAPTITEKFEITPGGKEDYQKLSRYHYRDSKLGLYKAIFTATMNKETIGVIVYTMPSPSLELRNIATGNFFKGHGRRTLLALVNKNVRTIARVIVDPRFRGLGLASRLVRETMPLMDVPVVESLAVIGLVNPFFEKAGMKAYKTNIPARCVMIKEALSLIGIEGDDLLDAELVQDKINRLSAGKVSFLERQIQRFLQAYGKRKYMKPSLERTGFVLSKLTDRPVYYIWFNPKFVDGNVVCHSE